MSIHVTPEDPTGLFTVLPALCGYTPVGGDVALIHLGPDQKRVSGNALIPGPWDRARLTDALDTIRTLVPDAVLLAVVYVDLLEDPDDVLARVLDTLGDGCLDVWLIHGTMWRSAYDPAWHLYEDDPNAIAALTEIGVDPKPPTRAAKRARFNHDPSCLLKLTGAPQETTPARARNAFGRLIAAAAHDQHGTNADARIVLGNINHIMGMLGEPGAADALRRLAQRLPDRPLAASLLLTTAVAYWLNGDGGSANMAVERVETFYPEHEQLPEVVQTLRTRPPAA